MPSSIEIFISYAHEDEELLKGLVKQLQALKYQGNIDIWYDRQMGAWSESTREDEKHLNSAQIILLLVSPDFMASDYCSGKKMRRAMIRHKRGEARVIPVILRPVYWQEAPFGKLQALPTDAKPIVNRAWHSLDDAFFDVAQGIRKAINEIVNQIKSDNSVHDMSKRRLSQISIKKAVRSNTKKTKEQWMEEGETCLDFRQYSAALAAFEQAIYLDHSFATAFNGKGEAFYCLNRYHEALAAFEQAISLNPSDAVAYNNKGSSLIRLNRYQEALAAIEQAVRLDPNYAIVYNNKGNALCCLDRYHEALSAYEQAIFLDPGLAVAYHNKGKALSELKRKKEAQRAYEQARQLGYGA